MSLNEKLINETNAYLNVIESFNSGNKNDFFNGIQTRIASLILFFKHLN